MCRMYSIYMSLLKFKDNILNLYYDLVKDCFGEELQKIREGKPFNFALSLLQDSILCMLFPDAVSLEVFTGDNNVMTLDQDHETLNCHQYSYYWETSQTF